MHPATLRNVTPIRDHFRLQAACVELEIEHELTQEPHIVDLAQSRERKARGRAADFEPRHGGQSFLAWTHEHVRPALLAALGPGQGGWQAMHRVAAAYDLDLKLRGAGLVISHRSKRPTAHQGVRREPQPVVEGHDGRAGTFQPSSERAQAAKRRESFQHIAADREKNRAARVEREREERRQARAAHSILNWQGYLEAEAAKAVWIIAASISLTVNISQDLMLATSSWIIPAGASLGDTHMSMRHQNVTRPFRERALLFCSSHRASKPLGLP